jgi:undecaprenyl-diphosphatase
MVSLLEAVVLGVVQGVTEWLPVSSSGHLVIFQQLFNLKASIAFDVMLHLATLVVIFLVFWKEIASVTKAFLRRDFSSPEGRMALFIIAGSIPTGIIGFLFYGFFESLFTNLTAVGAALIVTGFILLASRFTVKPRGLGYRKSVLVGIAQGIALIPGISRSGITISTGLLSGVKREEAVRYSFLLFIPAVIGAALYQAPGAVMNEALLPLIAGMIAAIIVGFVSLKALIRLVLKKRFWMFSIYCWIVGVLVILTQV